MGIISGTQTNFLTEAFWCGERVIKYLQGNMKLLVVVFALAAMVKAASVDTLNKDTFDTYLNENENVFVLFKVNWCRHCRRLAPTWEKLPDELEGFGIKVAKVDCTQSKDLCRLHGVRSYPTLKFFNNGTETSRYRGHRDLNSLAYFATDQAKENTI